MRPYDGGEPNDLLSQPFVVGFAMVIRAGQAFSAIIFRQIAVRANDALMGDEQRPCHDGGGF